MFEFSGNISLNCKKYIINRSKKISFFSTGITCIIVNIPLIYFMITEHWIFCFGVLTVFLIPFLSFLPLGKRFVNDLIPQKIIIKDNIISCIGKNLHESISVEHIKKIVDYGNWYHIFFHIGHRSQRYVCEKKLLVKGTIADFEEKFKDKIIRKQNKQSKEQD